MIIAINIASIPITMTVVSTHFMVLNFIEQKTNRKEREVVRKGTQSPWSSTFSL